MMPLMLVIKIGVGEDWRTVCSTTACFSQREDEALWTGTAWRLNLIEFGLEPGP